MDKPLVITVSFMTALSALLMYFSLNDATNQAIKMTRPKEVVQVNQDYNNDKKNDANLIQADGYIIPLVRVDNPDGTFKYVGSDEYEKLFPENTLDFGKLEALLNEVPKKE